MSFFDMFKPSSQEPKQQQQEKGLSEAPPTKNADGKMPGSSEIPPNPLDSYAKMFENATKNTASAGEAPKFALDPKVLGEVSSKLDFTQGVDQETMQKALNGDAKALMQVVNDATRNAYRAALEHGSTLTDTFVSQRSEHDKKQVGSAVRSQLTNNALASTPNYDHPVIKRELTKAAEAFEAANPDASPQEIAEAAKKYIQDIASALNPTSKTTSKETQEEGRDWEKYIRG
jgi:hypothetical protein